MNKDTSQGVTQSNDEPVRASFLALPQDNRKKIIWIGSLVAAVVVIGLVIAALTGFLNISFKYPNERIVVSPNVCPSTVVQQFNDALASRYSDASQVSNTTAVRQVVDDFSKNKSSEQDPTCLFMKYRYAIMTNDHATAKTAVERLEQLATQGLYVNGRVKGLVGFSDMNQAVQLITPEAEKQFDD